MTDLPDGLLLSRQEHVALITLNRPEKLNALSKAMYFGLDELVSDLAEDGDTSVIVLTGAGRAFCSGSDMNDFMSDLLDPDSPTYVPPPRIRYFDGVHKPIIVAVNGLCTAAGTELVLAGDLRIAVRDAWFGLAEVTMGMVPSGGSHTRLPRHVPWAIAMELLLTGNRITAQRGYDVGLINEVVDTTDELMAAAMSLARRVTQNSPAAVQLAKRIAVTGLQLDASFSLETDMGRQILDTADSIEGYRAFNEGRRPDFYQKDHRSE